MAKTKSSLKLVTKLDLDYSSFSVDVYTSIQNRTCLNVNAYFNSGFYKLGLARVHTNMPAETMVKLLISI